MSETECYQAKPGLQGRNWTRLRVAAPIRRACQETAPLIMRADLEQWRRFMAVIEWEVAP